MPDSRAKRTYLGPGEVTQPGARPRVRLEDGREREAQTAFTFPYRSEVGDRLLVIAEADAERVYAIGVLAGRPRARLEFQGDLDLRAVDGRLDLRAAEGLELESPRLTLRARVLRTRTPSRPSPPT